jgi:hypothetical protein
MVRASAEPIAVQAAAVQLPAGFNGGRQANRAAIDQASSLARSAREFAVRCHARQRRESDGAPFIEHPLEVARLLLDAGCSDVVVAAGLLRVTTRGRRVYEHRSAYDHHLRLEHYQQSLAMLQHVILRHPLVTLLADELDICPRFHPPQHD